MFGSWVSFSVLTRLALVDKISPFSPKNFGGGPMIFVITAQTKKDSQASHTDFTRSVYMESDTQPDNQTVLKKWKQKYGEDIDESTLEIEPVQDMDADKLRAGGLEVTKI
jgi:hypothetical protein